MTLQSIRDYRIYPSNFFSLRDIHTLRVSDHIHEGGIPICGVHVRTVKAGPADGSAPSVRLTVVEIVRSLQYKHIGMSCLRNYSIDFDRPHAKWTIVVGWLLLEIKIWTFMPDSIGTHCCDLLDDSSSKFGYAIQIFLSRSSPEFFAYIVHSFLLTRDMGLSKFWWNGCWSGRNTPHQS